MNTRRLSCRFALWSALLAYSAFAACGDVTSEAIVRSPSAGEACDADTDCAEAAPRCDLDAARCVQCLSPTDCPDGQACSLPAGICVPSCSEGSGCDDEQPICDGSSGLCRGCSDDGECPESVPRCDATGACIECVGPSDCDEDEPFCDASGRCVECLTDGHCEDVDDRCSPALGECAEPCSGGEACDSDDPICDVNIGFCVECLTDEHCDDDERCRGWECVE